MFDGAGMPYSLKAVNELNREGFEHLGANSENLSSYSWRRAGPTAAALLKFFPLGLCSLGDWADKSGSPGYRMGRGTSLRPKSLSTQRNSVLPSL